MLDEKKVFKDNILGYIEISEHDEIIWQLINTKEFQRLRRIKQLGGIHMVFHTAEHTRFAHSLGVYEIARRMSEQIRGLALNEYDRMLLLCCALLHDLGHGPFSHAFEAISKIDHEDMTKAIILGDSNINQVLTQTDAKLPNDICKVLSHEYENPLIYSMISSQFDADRLDYLERDSYNSGVEYGKIDVDRLFRIMKVIDNKICFKKSAISEVEIYLLSRGIMHRQIYFHPNGRSYEVLLQKCLERYFDLLQTDYMFAHDYNLLQFLSSDTLDLDKFYLLDDTTMFFYLKLFMDETDPILKDLSTRFIERKLFKFVVCDDEKVVSKLQKAVASAGYDSAYYVAFDEQKTKLYDEHQPIYLYEAEQITLFSKASDIVNKLAKTNRAMYIFYPDYLEKIIKKALRKKIDN